MFSNEGKKEMLAALNALIVELLAASKVETKKLVALLKFVFEYLVGTLGNDMPYGALEERIPAGNPLELGVLPLKERDYCCDSYVVCGTQPPAALNNSRPVVQQRVLGPLYTLLVAHGYCSLYWTMGGEYLVATTSIVNVGSVYEVTNLHILLLDRQAFEIWLAQELVLRPDTAKRIAEGILVLLDEYAASSRKRIEAHERRLDLLRQVTADLHAVPVAIRVVTMPPAAATAPAAPTG